MTILWELKKRNVNVFKIDSTFMQIQRLLETVDVAQDPD